MMKLDDSEKTRKMVARVFAYSFGSIYELYIQKVERKGRTQEELDIVLRWLTGHTPDSLRQQVANGCTLEQFFDQAPEMNPNAVKITGVICGYRVEEIENLTLRRIRCMDKLVDELAQGRAMEKILRA